MARWTRLIAIAVALLASAATCGDDDESDEGAGVTQDGGMQPSQSGAGGSAGTAPGGGGRPAGGSGSGGTGSGESGGGAGEPAQDAGSAECNPACEAGQECVLVQVTCVRAPCPPQPTCVAAGGSGGSCGSRGLGPCADGEFCDHPPSAMCGEADAPGECRVRPSICQRDYQPVCGCDGETYSNACGAAAAGVSVRSEGECGGRAELDDCNLSRIACDSPEPSCPEGETPSVNGGCYGPCVAMERCACSGPEDCPNPDQYTCHRSAGHCGPYV